MGTHPVAFTESGNADQWAEYSGRQYESAFPAVLGADIQPLRAHLADS